MFIKEARQGERPLGKIDASLNEKLQNVKWGEYEATELFNVLTVKHKLTQEKLSDDYNFPAYSAESENGGIIGYTDTPEFICDRNTPIYVTFGDHTRVFNIAKKSFSVLDNVKVLMPSTNKEKALLFILSAWTKLIPNLGYARHWKVAKDCIIQLPTKDGQIDFEFMESFIAELEARHIAELEAYLTVTGLKDYTLTKDEEKALEEYSTLHFANYPVIDIFDVKNTANILSNEIIENSGTTPYLCASANNNAVSSYISFDEKYLEQGNCIFIGGKTFVVSYQEKNFYSNDSHNLALYLKNEKRDRFNQLYLATCVYRSLCHKYSWGNSISKTKIKLDYVSIPTKDGKPDYASMGAFISAIQKLVIKDVVLYSDREIKEIKKLVGGR